MTELLKNPASAGPRPRRDDARLSGRASAPVPWSVPEERCVVRLLVGERRGRVVTLVLYPAADAAVSKLVAALFPRILEAETSGGEGRIVCPGDCRARLRAEFRHRSIRVKG